MEIAKQNNALLFICDSELEVEETSALVSALEYNQLTVDEMKKLAHPKLKLIDFIEKKWQLTIMWLMYSPQERYKKYPFDQPQIRSFIKAYKPWFNFQESTYILCAVVHATSPQIRQIFKNHFILFGAYVIQHRITMLNYVISEQVDTLTNEVNRCLKALDAFERWLLFDRKKFDYGNPKHECIWGGILSEVLYASGNQTDISPAKRWIKEFRRWQRYCLRTKGLYRACADKEQIFRLTSKGKRRIQM